MKTDIVIVGAGAAGLMCAAMAGARGRQVILIEHTAKIGEKIRISGGGRSNFTNLYCAPDRYICSNQHFAKSALKRFTQHDFIAMVERHKIAYHEKTLGQLFCDNSANDIINMLLDMCEDAGVRIFTSATISKVEQQENGFTLSTSGGEIETESLVIASGGLSIPKIGASPFGYEIAKQFGLDIIPTRAGLVPLTFHPDILDHTKELSGVSVDPVIMKSECGKTFEEALLFTHRGISGPAVLQISSYWQPGETISVNFNPHQDTLAWLKTMRQQQPKSMAHNILGELLPKRLSQKISEELQLDSRMADLSDKRLNQIAERIANWTLTPAGSEGYRTAEVTLGGVNTDHVSSKTFECKDVKGLYFIGEVLDVTGHLGGFNFQWAWSSGWCAGQYA